MIRPLDTLASAGTSRKVIEGFFHEDILKIDEDWKLIRKVVAVEEKEFNHGPGSLLATKEKQIALSSSSINRPALTLAHWQC